MSADFRSGFVCIVGRPNAGKSTLTNALVGDKVAITSGRPQTTRHVIRGVVHHPQGQIILVDTPGVHRPRTLLGERLNALVQGTLAEVDLVVFCLPADQAVGPGDRFIASTLADVPTPVIAVVTKTDKVSKGALAEHLLKVSQLMDFAAIVPVSALKGQQLDVLTTVLLDHLEPGPAIYGEHETTDEPVEVMIAELVREAALEGVREEMPHSLAVVVEEIVPRPDRDDGLLDVRVNLFVERPSQKAIIIGARGSRLREVGTNARGAIEKILNAPIYLDLHVKVARDWQRDPKQLRRLGFS